MCKAAKLLILHFTVRPSGRKNPQDHLDIIYISGRGFEGGEDAATSLLPSQRFGQLSQHQDPKVSDEEKIRILHEANLCQWGSKVGQGLIVQEQHAGDFHGVAHYTS